MSLSPEIVAVLAIFQSAFTCPTWNKAQVLILGTLLARGRRTVAAALRQMGRGEQPDFSLYHQVLNRASWSRAPMCVPPLPVLPPLARKPGW